MTETTATWSLSGGSLRSQTTSAQIGLGVIGFPLAPIISRSGAGWRASGRRARPARLLLGRCAGRLSLTMLLVVALDPFSSRIWKGLHTRSGATGRSERSPLQDLFVKVCAELDVTATFEIGAHSADFSRAVVQAIPGVHARAYEANPYVFDHFRPTLPAGIAYINLAISSDTAARPIHIPRSIPNPKQPIELTRLNQVSSLKLRAREAQYESILCDCTTLDLLHEQSGWPPSALWIDVEGAGGDVLMGGFRAFEKCVQCVLIEVEETSVWLGQWLAQDVRRFMGRMGFTLAVRDAETAWQYNMMFVRSTVAEAAEQLVVRYADELFDQIETSRLSADI